MRPMQVYARPAALALFASWMGPHMLRRAGCAAQGVGGAALQDAKRAARAGLMRVAAVEQLAAAIQQAVPHIVIEAHLDLRGLPTQAGAPPIAFALDRAIMTIRVRLGSMPPQLPERTQILLASPRKQ